MLIAEGWIIARKIWALIVFLPHLFIKLIISGLLSIACCGSASGSPYLIAEVLFGKDISPKENLINEAAP